MALFEKELGLLRAHLKKARLKQSLQREAVLKALLEGPKYVTLDELTKLAQARDKSIGNSTVYRATKLFIEAGLAKEHKFLYGGTCFERGVGGEPHDYLICKQCGKVQEFSNPLIQAVQEKVSKELDFKLQEHRVELYGICSDCRGPKHKRKDDED